LGEAAPGQAKQVAYGVDAQSREGLGESVVGIEEIERQGGEKTRFGFPGQAMKGRAAAHPVPSGQQGDRAGGGHGDQAG